MQSAQAQRHPEEHFLKGHLPVLRRAYQGSFLNFACSSTASKLVSFCIFSTDGCVMLRFISSTMYLATCSIMSGSLQITGCGLFPASEVLMGEIEPA